MSGDAADALRTAATYAGYAPSIHNTQPWRWELRGQRLVLHGVSERQLVADDGGRMATVSCGAALHHAEVALDADGWRHAVELLPDRADPATLAELHSLVRVEPDHDAQRLLTALKVRRTDRRPAPEVDPPAAAVERVRRAVGDGVDLHLLTPGQVIELAVAAGTAHLIEKLDGRVREELAYWTSRHAPAGTGLPADVLPAANPPTGVPDRDFGVAGALPVGPGHDRHARYGLLVGPADEPDWWLRAGRALSAAWLTAVTEGLELLPMSGAIEVDATREMLREALGGVAHPYLAMRLGRAHPQPPPGERTPRLPQAQLVEGA